MLDQDFCNLSDLLWFRLQATPAAPAYLQYDGRQWVETTWADIGRGVARWQMALAREHLKPGDRVALCLRNSVEWVLFDQAALILGLVTVPLYFDDRPDNMAWCLNDSGARLLFLEDASRWPELRARVKTVERVVCLHGESDSEAKLVSLARWLPAEVQSELTRATSKSGVLATIVYTSGTTGRPKGVMLSQQNILSNVIASMHAIPIHTHDRLLSFLPLSHMFERTCGYYSAIWAGAQTVYARSISGLADDIREQQPMVLISVPRIFERIYSKMQESMAEGSFKRRLFESAVDVGWRRFRGEASARDRWIWPLLDFLVARKLRRSFGGRIRLVIVGGAAFAPHLARVFLGLGLPIIQGYGLTETSPVLAANRAGDNDPATVGRALEGVELRCDETGELLARGPNLMQGYWNNPAATSEILDRDGWLHTGDLATVHGGRVTITGRVKDVIVLSNGEKVPPADAENAILRDTAFEQVLLLGEGRAKLGLLAVSKITDKAELCMRANAQLHDFPGYARIHHVANVTEPWTVENGLLTPTLKPKRREIEIRYETEIAAMYAVSNICRPSD
ncbi:MAG: AMP-dependent synthetase/ligase [Sulfuricaulis sp.]|uniref:long-chain fatty acid--CoA ligase n=1 Tax=Sulfuricaulis sp. TaxID=2003553 RepID=UPI0034A3A92A